MANLLDCGKADVNATLPEFGDTALLMAAERGHVGVCELLVSFSADVSIRETTYNNSALDRATALGHAQVVFFLRSAVVSGMLAKRHASSNADKTDDAWRLGVSVSRRPRASTGGTSSISARATQGRSDTMSSAGHSKSTHDQAALLW